MTDVTFEHAEYAACRDKWALINCVVEGQAAVKAGKTTYLPKPNPDDKSTENDTRYKQYLVRAVFYNVTGRTLQGLVGAGFKKSPELKTSLNYAANDIDGAGVSIYQQSQSVLGSVLSIGRHALLVDYPTTKAPSSMSDMASGKLRATAVSIPAENVINWRLAKVGAEFKLVLVVIKEAKETVAEDGFGVASEDQYRVLRLTEEGYTQELWRKIKETWQLVERPLVVLDSTGNPWDEIPFTFVGAQNNDASVDSAPLYDLAEINIAHYRNSADYEDSVFFVGQAQPWMSGLTVEWRDHIEKEGVYVGSRSPILLPEGGAYGIESATPNTLAKEAMDQKESQMVALGARLVQPGAVVKTVAQAEGNNEVEHSVLSLASGNVSAAYSKVLGWMGRFMGETGEALYELNKDFAEHHLDPQMLTALIMSWQSGRLPESDLWGQLKKYGVIDPEKTDEEIKEELDSQDSGLGLDDLTTG